MDLEEFEDKEDYEQQRLELVIKQSDWLVKWDRKYGSYWLYEGEVPSGWASEPPEPKEKMWRPEFERRFGIYDGRESPHIVYDPDEEYTDVLSGTKKDWKRHIIQDGSCICNVNPPKVSPDETEQLTPIPQNDPEEYDRLLFSVCANCRSSLPVKRPEESD